VHEFKIILHEAEKWPEKHALEGEAAEFPNGWSREDALAAKYAPATSAEVEQTFSNLKYLLSDRRLTMTFKTLSSYLIVYNNYKNY
jgi:hypothetical protein